jgi:GNAT superfamily N-acetyltransferase
MNLRPLNFETDGQSALALINTFYTEPIQLSEFEYWIKNLPPGRTARRMVVQNEQGEIVGYSFVGHETWEAPGHFSVWLIVAPEHRRQGIGTALYADLEAYVRANGAERMVMEVNDNDPSSRQFAERRGFVAERHLFESVLDLQNFDERPYAGLIEQVEASGIRFFSLMQAGDTREALQKLHAVNYATALDIPGSDETWMPFDEFERMVRQAEWFNPHGQLLAADGEEYIGLAAVQLIPEKNGAYNLMTGVLEPYRGRKIALALKLLAIRYAHQHGATYIRTHNDSLNAPMLAINRKLGYQPLPGKYLMKKDKVGKTF